MKILITGKDSYVGSHVRDLLHKAGHEVEELEMRSENWHDKDFSGYDTVFHVAGIAHDAGKKSLNELYLKVNRDLAIETAKKARRDGVKQFIFMSSMLVYNGTGEKIIKADTVPKAKGIYAKSKLEADQAISDMRSQDFKVAIVRPPMIFGKECKGNFPKLVNLSLKTPFFPKIENSRSMLYIDNLSELIRLIIETKSEGIFFPQNSEYFKTYEIAAAAAGANGKKLYLTRLFNWLVYLFMPFVKPLKKMFGTLTYDKSLSEAFNGTYNIVGNTESIKASISKD